MKSFIYICPSYDTIHVKIFPTINKFILIDPQPSYCSRGIECYKNTKNYINREKEYLFNLSKIYTKLGYKLYAAGNSHIKFKRVQDHFKRVQDHFKNTNHSIVEYYYNTIFNENMEDCLKEKIRMCDTIIIRDKDPDKYMLELLPEKFDIVVISERYNKNRLFMNKKLNDELRERINQICVIFTPEGEDNNISDANIIELEDFDKMLRLLDDIKYI